MSYERLHAAVTRAAVAEIHEIVGFFLADLIGGRTALRAVRHPLGFFCLPVHRDGPEGICVHVWPEHREPDRLATTPYHCHSWELLSHILYGTVGNQRVDVRDGDTYRIFEVQSAGLRDQLVPTPRLVDARLRDPEFFGAGQKYTLAAGEFHASVIGAGAGAATVALGRQRPGQPDWTLADPSLTAIEECRQECSADETLAVARLVAGRLDPVYRPETLALSGVATE